MKVLSYSLFGDQAMYCVGAIKNAELAMKLYPGWKCFFWHDNTVPSQILGSLGKFSNVHLIDVGQTDVPGRYWRFNLFDNNDVEVFCSRDTDSRPSQREVEAVNEWLSSDKTMHVMRDHPHHNYIVMAGMWGFKNQKYWNYNEELKNWLASIKNHNKIDDTLFLDKLFNNQYPDIMVHDDWGRCPASKKFPQARINQRFIGEIFSELDEPMFEHYKSIQFNE